MGREGDALNREMRQLMILSLLRRKPSKRARPGEIRDALAFVYPGMNDEALHRRFSEDMDGLRSAGLIAYEDLRTSRRVALTVPQKDPSLYLTQDEHRALGKARDRLDWNEITSPISHDPCVSKLAYAVQTLRLIEEGSSEIGDLAEALQVRPRKIREILERLGRVGPVAEVLTEFAIERDPISDRVQAGFLPPSDRRDRPLEDRGLDEIGLFAYSREEVEDRIAMIGKALKEEWPQRDMRALQSARTKLEAWRRMLP